MAKKPTNEDAAETKTVLEGEPVDTADAAKPFFISSMSQASLQDINAAARAEADARNAKMEAAHKAALDAVNAAFGSTTVPKEILEQIKRVR